MSTRKISSTRTSETLDLFKRRDGSSLISPESLIPSDPRLSVVGVLNPAFLRVSQQDVLIARVDEKVRGGETSSRLQFAARPASRSGAPLIASLPVDAPISKSEPVLPAVVRDGLADQGLHQLMLTHLSHLRAFELLPDGSATQLGSGLNSSYAQTYGFEDPRATLLDGVWRIVCSRLEQFGSITYMFELNDDTSIGEPHIVLGPDHKHTILFPEKVDGAFWALTRPLARMGLDSGIWLLRSKDLRSWGDPAPLIFPRHNLWDSDRVGPCAPPVLVENGWLLFYYGVDSEDSYLVGCALLDRSDPRRLISRSEIPVLTPLTPRERVGRRCDTVFPCGARMLDGFVRLYYGAADTSVECADAKCEDILALLDGAARRDDQ